MENLKNSQNGLLGGGGGVVCVCVGGCGRGGVAQGG